MNPIDDDETLAVSIDELIAEIAVQRASMKYCDIVRLANRAFRAAESSDAATAEIARATLRHIRDMAAYPQARSLAAMFLRVLERTAQ